MLKLQLPTKTGIDFANSKFVAFQDENNVQALVQLLTTIQFRLIILITLDSHWQQQRPHQALVDDVQLLE